MPVDPIIRAQGTFLEIAPLSGELTPTLTPYAARNLTATLEPISGQSWFRRDVNGFLRDLSDERFRKYKLSVKCRDGESPCLDNAWLGVIVGVSCPCELSYPAGGTPSRTVVSGSSRTVNGFVYYRPYLTMMVTGISDANQEWQAYHNWDLTLEEV